MNLQVCLPYQPCKFHCPMCIARGHRHGNRFENLYKKNKFYYLALLKKKVSEMEPNSSVVLTGECDPTQDMKFCRDVIRTVRRTRKDVKIELQTHNYEYKGGLNIDVLSYSITNLKSYLLSRHYHKEKHPRINRLVILLTKNFSGLNDRTFDDMGYDQITFKTLQHGEDTKTNMWVDLHKLENIDNIKAIKRPGISIRIDTSCQTATGRYEIFRSDGEVYTSWEERSKQQ